MQLFQSLVSSDVARLLRQFGVSKAALFGSHARGEAGINSDLDILVEMRKDLSLLKFIELKQALEALLQLKIDLVEYDRIKPVLRNSILKDEMVFYKEPHGE